MVPYIQGFITTFSDYLRQVSIAHQNLARSLLANASNLNGAEMGQHTRIFHQNLTQALDQIYRKPNRRSPRNYFDRILADQAEWWYSTDLTNPEQ